ncbi:acetyltransferase GNAT family protein [Asticcacaulis biprosthecium C19]|uniref:Acetyltransferase GNAT family protein n=1 Tax=Asticcacaulis biprosthecium C19 TaxID=715226 RepID=F4QME7_9CAUL|nr:GNAT family N-acetyltransferase [Asticcacaulis biprosthecium]EGF91388.1 acetyltransferase GNAT family protein [Asticcacaulis biprosthecium C19]
MIIPADFTNSKVLELLQYHAAEAAYNTAPGSAHALDLSGLTAPDVSVWTLWDGDDLVGVGGLKTLSPTEGEIKAMHVVASRRGAGLGGRILAHIVAESRARGLKRLNLETGAWPFFAPAWALYRRHGFVECGLFGDYLPDPNSLFFTLALVDAYVFSLSPPEGRG